MISAFSNRGDVINIALKNNSHKEGKSLNASVVYGLLAKIPRGKVSTYADIARAAGCPTGARAIGRILHINPNPIVVPCHRVIKSNGQIGGYAYGTQMKKDILRKEGVIITNGKAQHFNEIRTVFV